MAKRVGIIGYPIGHSISPIFQQAALDYYSLDTTYHAWELEPKLLPDFIKGLRTGDTLGINVTVPHKEAVMAHLDYIDERAEKAGAVNTVVNDGGKLTGHNTDGSGFLKALKEHRCFSPGGRRVLIIGAGGSAKAVALALAHEGVATIDIANRTLNRAQRLAELLNSGSVCGHAQEWPTVNAIPLVHQGDVLVRAAARSDLVGELHDSGDEERP